MTELFFKNQSETSMRNLTPGVREGVSEETGAAEAVTWSYGFHPIKIVTRVGGGDGGWNDGCVADSTWRVIVYVWSLNIIIEN